MHACTSSRTRIGTILKINVYDYDPRLKLLLNIRITNWSDT